ncbi:MAG: endonuclease/exonuclease/phosphatase family protein [Bacteroidia bacterium]
MKVFNKIVLFLNWALILLLLGAYLAAFISPVQLWFVAFLGLAFPIIFIANSFFVLYWLINLNWNIIYSLVALIIGINVSQRFIQFGTKKENVIDNYINIVDFNTHAFDAFEDKDYVPELFFETLNDIKPDVMCFQEFVSYDTKKDKAMFKQLVTEYKDFYTHNMQANEDKITGYSISILSRYPIVNSGFVERVNSNGNATIFADIKYKNDTIRIINTHLKSIAFDKKDFQTVAEIETDKNEKEVGLLDIKSIAGKLKRAFINRSKQAEAIQKFIEKSKHKIILTGDFNDSPASYAYNIIKGDMKDAFIESGSGFSSTYTGKMPSFRIDYILADKGFEIVNYKPYQLNFSDHKMLSATVKIK